MRKITKEATTAFLNRQIYTKSGNTKVTESFGVFYLRLHGNIIAELYPNNTLKVTNAGWFSNTTRERLNGLPDVYVQQKNWVWYLNGEQWDGSLTKIN